MLRWPKRGGVGMLAGFLLLSAVGCGGFSLVDQKSPTPELPPPSSVQDHDVAIAATAFDPPLTPGQILPAGPITLRVVVDNKGRFREDNVTVVATLFDGEGKQLIKRSALIGAIAPGESQVVRFGSLPVVPPSPSYALRVEVAAVPGEEVLTNNSKAYLFVMSSPG